MASILKSTDFEIWKPLPHTGEMLSEYMVSNFGRVKAVSVCRVINGKYRNIKKDRILKLSNNGNGYKYFCALVDGKRKHFYIHQIVAELFLGKPEPGMVVNHKDYDRGNNRADNLEWCTTLENIRYSIPNMRRPKMMYHGRPSKHIRKRKHGYEVVVCRHYVGTYKSEEEAINERDKYVEEHYNIRH